MLGCLIPNILAAGGAFLFSVVFVLIPKRGTGATDVSFMKMLSLELSLPVEKMLPDEVVFKGLDSLGTGLIDIGGV